MATELDKDGSVFYSPRRALSLAVFYAFAMQCMSTLAVMKRETNWSWAIGQFLYMGALAWISSFWFGIFLILIFLKILKIIRLNSNNPLSNAFSL